MAELASAVGTSEAQRASQPAGEPAATSSKPEKKLWKVEMPTDVPAQSGWCRCVEDCYTIVKQIGEGTYGQVYLAKETQTQAMVALKKIRMDTEKEGFPITAMREMRLLTRLQHQNVLSLKEVVRSRPKKSNQESGSIYMVFEYMDHDLTGLMERRNYKFQASHAKCYMKQILMGLNYCHGHLVLHRDLKAANLLINNKGELKLADFGLARSYSEKNARKPVEAEAGRDEGAEKYTARVITLWYRPPELILGHDRYGPEVDMWSVGCIFAELLMGKALFPGKDDPDQIDRITKLCGSITEDTTPGCKRFPQPPTPPVLCSINYVKPGRPSKLREHLQQARLDPEAVNLLCNLLHLDPRKRLLTREAFGHEYFYSEPFPAQPGELPQYEASHEMDMKQKRSRMKEAGPHAPHAENGHDAKRQRTSAPQGYPPQGAMRPPPSQAPHPSHSRAPAQQYPAMAPPGGYMAPPASVPQRSGRPPDPQGGYGAPYQQPHGAYPPRGGYAGPHSSQYMDRPDPYGYHSGQGQYPQYPPAQGAYPPGPQGGYGGSGRGYGHPAGVMEGRGPAPRGHDPYQQQYPPGAHRDDRARQQYPRGTR